MTKQIAHARRGLARVACHGNKQDCEFKGHELTTELVAAYETA